MANSVNNGALVALGSCLPPHLYIPIHRAHPTVKTMSKRDIGKEIVEGIKEIKEHKKKNMGTEFDFSKAKRAKDVPHLQKLQTETSKKVQITNSADKKAH